MLPLRVDSDEIPSLITDIRAEDVLGFRPVRAVRDTIG